MGCWMCLPGCDKCQPKFFECPYCDGLAYFALESCPVCHHLITEEDRERGRDGWYAKHPERSRPVS